MNYQFFAKMSKIQNKFQLMNELTLLYQELISQPRVVTGQILSNLATNRLISATWSQRSLERNQNISFNALYQVYGEEVFNLPSTDVSTELFSLFSPSEKRKCVVRSVPDGSKKKQFLEIWQDGRILKNVDTGAIDLHGDIYTNGDLASLNWSSNENAIVYIAEKKRIKPEPFFSSKPRKEPEDGSFPYGEEYTFIEDWGEQMNGQSQSVVVIFDINDGIRILDGIPEGFSAGQVIWNEKDDGVYGIVYETIPRRLGMIYCTNRLGFVFHLSLNGELSLLSILNKSPRYVCLNKQKNQLIWMEREGYGPHNTCQSLVKMDIDSKAIATIVPIIDTEIDVTNGKFTGMYNKLKQRCLTNDGKFLIFDSICYNKNFVYSVEIESGKLALLGEGEVLDVYENSILISKASPFEFPSLLLLNFADQLVYSTIEITETVLMDNVISEGVIIDFPVDGVAYDKFNLMLIKPKFDGDKKPLIVFPHGGPHSANYSTFMLEPAFFAKLGFSVLLINYRGSLGMGKNAVDSLLNQIGTLDVQDVQRAVQYVLQNHTDIDESKIVAYGGSHGGFLSLHLAGQYPDIYKCVVVRNPVVDLPSMFVVSDIPDWVQIECGSNYDAAKLPTAEEHEKMAEFSPIRYFGDYKAPTLFLTGKNDQRVPLSQSIHYHKLLKAKNVKTKLHMYPDDHSLSSVPVHFDALINSLFWIYESLEK